MRDVEVGEEGPSTSKNGGGASASAAVDLRLACMLNTHISTVLAVLRSSNPKRPFVYSDSPITHSLKSLRLFIFNPQQPWHSLNPLLYLSPFLDLLLSDSSPPAAATAAAISAVFHILRLGIFDCSTPGAGAALDAAVSAAANCRLERTDRAAEDDVLIGILRLMISILKSASRGLLSKESVSVVAGSCFLTLRMSAGGGRGAAVRRAAWWAAEELVEAVFGCMEGEERGGHGADVFRFLCCLLEEVEGEEVEAEEDGLQVLALGLINCGIEKSGEEIADHPELLRLVEDDLFRLVVRFGGCSSSPVLLSLICTIFLNLYCHLRRFLRLQMEVFFTTVLFRAAEGEKGSSHELKEVAMEAVINLCRFPSFAIETFVSYDCDPSSPDIFEHTVNLLCKYAFPASTTPLTTLQIQALDSLITIIDSISADLAVSPEGPPLGLLPPAVERYRPVWEEPAAPFGEEEEDAWADFLLQRKAQKKKMMIAGSHYNYEEEKGMEYLKSSGVLPDPPHPKTVAFFFRFVKGVDKTAMGEYFGSPEGFRLEVLNEFTKTFDFSGMLLDAALRAFLGAFRLPGESQKIQRILESFSDRFFDPAVSDALVSKDVVLVLCYSIIMLNTDLHSPQVKKKMTEEDFIRNNRAINDGDNLPQDYLARLFRSISGEPISLSGDASPPTGSRWTELINRSSASSSSSSVLSSRNSRLLQNLFLSISGPSVATLSAVFEQADRPDLLRRCASSLFAAAGIVRHGPLDALDEIICSLCRSTTLLNPYVTPEETAHVLCTEAKPRLAVLAAFSTASSFRGSVRSAWRSVVDCLLKLRGLRLRLGPVFLEEMEQSVVLMEDVFSKSSDMDLESLKSLGRALISAAAGRGQRPGTAAEEDETAAFCWGRIAALASSNAGRILAFWPCFHEQVSAVGRLPFFSPTPFCERAVESVLKICGGSAGQGTEEAEDSVLKTVNLILRLDREVVDGCSVAVAQAVAALVRESGRGMRTALSWKTILHLLCLAGRHEEAYPACVEAVMAIISSAPPLSPANYTACMECALGLAALKNGPAEGSVRLVGAMAETTRWVGGWEREERGGGGGEAAVGLFIKLGEALRRASMARREEVRVAGIGAMRRSVEIAAGEMEVSGGGWVCYVTLVVFGLVDELQEKMAGADFSRTEGGRFERGVLESMGVLVDVFVWNLGRLGESARFGEVWLGFLRRMGTCSRSASADDLHRAVAEWLGKLLPKIREEEEKEGGLFRAGELRRATFNQLQWIASSLPPDEERAFTRMLAQLHPR